MVAFEFRFFWGGFYFLFYNNRFYLFNHTWCISNFSLIMRKKLNYIVKILYKAESVHFFCLLLWIICNQYHYKNMVLFIWCTTNSNVFLYHQFISVSRSNYYQIQWPSIPINNIDTFWYNSFWIWHMCRDLNYNRLKCLRAKRLKGQYF